MVPPSIHERSGHARLAVPSAVVLVAILAPWAMRPQVAIAQSGPENQDVQVLTRGPVHEAFAAPVVNDPGPGLVVAKQPPAAVEELPPDQKPAGQNVQWISGYWSWDESRKDFVWISGVWREPPPGRQWVPGYWNRVDGGFQWVPGAWVPVAQPAGEAAASGPQSQAAYLPAPPTSLEQGPSSPQPTGNVFWSPGSWYWQGGRYVWRPGFWAAVQSEWLWVPPHYVWTPGGYLFVEGYWDLPLTTRGVLFAPVYYAQPVYLQPAYVFTPSITIATPGLVANLFVMPSYRHYCFGDYYDRSFLNVGIVPWFSFTYVSGPARPVFYDPLFTFYASVNVRRDPGWVTRVREEYVVRRDNVAMRPPRTYVEQTRIIERNVTVNRSVNITRNVNVIARPLAQAGPEGGARFERVSPELRRQWQDRGSELRQLGAQRLRQERQAAGWRAGGAAEGPRVARAEARPRPMTLPASPVAAPLHQHTEPARATAPIRRPQHNAEASPLAAEGLHRTPVTAGNGRPVPPGATPPMRHEPDRTASVPTHGGGPGRIAPRDVPPASMQDRMTTRGARAGSPAEASRLHAPPQYTHRQPPPPPRPLRQKENGAGPRPRP